MSVSQMSFVSAVHVLASPVLRQGCIWLVTAWLLIALAVNVPMLYAGRVVAGFCVGVVSLCFPVYLGETLQPEVRGMLGLLPTAFGNVGKLPQPTSQRRWMCYISSGDDRPVYRQRIKFETYYLFTPFTISNP